MKIAQVVSTFYPRLGGMGQICLAESERLAAAGHEVTVFTLQYDPADNAAILPFRVVRIRPWFRLGDAGFVPALRSLLQGFDIVHLHYPFYGGAEWVFKAVGDNKQKLVITYHMDAQPVGFLKRIIQKIYDLIWPKIIFNRAQKIILVDNDTTGKQFNLKKYLAPGKIAYLPNAVDKNIFQNRKNSWSDLGWGDLMNKKVWLFVANPMPVKRLDLALRALEKLPDKDVVLLVVGEGYDLEKYKNLVKELKVEKQVIFAGAGFDSEKLSQFYSAADGVLVPSDYESFSLVTVEAMLCGAMVIGSDIPGIRGRISNQKTGFLFTPGSVEDLVRVWQEVLNLDSTARENILMTAKNEAEQKYGWDNHMKNLLAIYNNL